MGHGKTEANNQARAERCMRSPDDCEDPIDGGLGYQQRKGLLSIPNIDDMDFNASWRDKI